MTRQYVKSFQLGWFSHPIFSKTGDYSQYLKDIVGNNSEPEQSRLPQFTESEIKLLQGNILVSIQTQLLR